MLNLHMDKNSYIIIRMQIDYKTNMHMIIFIIVPNLKNHTLFILIHIY